MKWFRFYDEALDDPKVQRLSGDLFKLWINLLCLANRGKDRGMLPASLDDIAWALRLDIDWLRASVHTLQGQGLLDWCDDEKQYQPHNWEGRQYASDDVTARVDKHRRNKAVTPVESETLHETLHVTPPEADTETDTETEQKMPGTAQKAPAPPPQKRRISKDFTVTDRMREWATEKGYTTLIDIDFETEEFVTHWRGVGTAMADWEQTWQNDMIKKAGWAKNRTRQAGSRNGVTKAVPITTPDDPDGSERYRKSLDRPGFRQNLPQRGNHDG